MRELRRWGEGRFAAAMSVVGAILGVCACCACCACVRACVCACVCKCVRAGCTHPPDKARASIQVLIRVSSRVFTRISISVFGRIFSRVLRKRDAGSGRNGTRDGAGRATRRDGRRAAPVYGAVRVSERINRGGEGVKRGGTGVRGGGPSGAARGLEPFQERCRGRRGRPCPRACARASERASEHA